MPIKIYCDSAEIKEIRNFYKKKNSKGLYYQPKLNEKSRGKKL